MILFTLSLMVGKKIVAEFLPKIIDWNGVFSREKLKSFFAYFNTEKLWYKEYF